MVWLVSGRMGEDGSLYILIGDNEGRQVWMTYVRVLLKPCPHSWGREWGARHTVGQ